MCSGLKLYKTILPADPESTLSARLLTEDKQRGSLMIKYYNSLQRSRVIVRLSTISLPGGGSSGSNSEPSRRPCSKVLAHPVQSDGERSEWFRMSSYWPDALLSSSLLGLCNVNIIWLSQKKRRKNLLNLSNCVSMSLKAFPIYVYGDPKGTLPC